MYKYMYILKYIFIKCFEVDLNGGTIYIYFSVYMYI